MDKSFEDLANKTGYKTTQSMQFLHNLIAAVQPMYVLELGTAFGSSSAYMASALESGKVITIDNYSGMYAKNSDEVFANLDRLNVSDRVILLEGDTHKSAIVLQDAGLGISPEIVFMDADHSYKGLSAEYFSFAPLLPQKHLVIIDDYIATEPDCRVFVSEMSRKYEHTLTIKSFHWGMAILCSSSDYLLSIAQAIKEVKQ